MIALMYGARSRVVLTSPYVIPSEAFLSAMCSTARRGVAVDLIVDAESNKPMVQLAQRSFYDTMLLLPSANRFRAARVGVGAAGQVWLAASLGVFAMLVNCPSHPCCHRRPGGRSVYLKWRQPHPDRWRGRERCRRHHRCGEFARLRDGPYRPHGGPSTPTQETAPPRRLARARAQPHGRPSRRHPSRWPGPASPGHSAP